MGSAKRASDTEQRTRILTRKLPAVGRSISDAVVIKDGDVFLVTRHSGNIPARGRHGFGLYYHDCRFLDGYELSIDGRDAIPLVSAAAAGFKAIVELTNSDLPRPGGGAIDKHEIALRWERTLESQRCALHDVIRVRNFSADPVEITISLAFAASFADIYTVRGLLAAQPGAVQPPHWKGDTLYLAYEGRDQLRRTTAIHFWRHPDRTEPTGASFCLRLDPEAEEELALTIVLSETPTGSAVDGKPEPPDLHRIAQEGHAAVEEQARSFTQIETDDVSLDRTVGRSLRDLAMLRSRLTDETYLAAGVPWFVALFGRDALFVALMALAYDPSLAADTLRLLAQYQGKKYDPKHDEEPGKILHEHRVGELARTGAVPQTPYYGTVDATPLFLVLMAQHAAWTGSLDLFRELHGNVDAALGWIAAHERADEGGFVAYRSEATNGLANHGWKDSGDAIVMESGSLARQPIALVEVQGYVYLAKISIAALFDRAGEHERAARLRGEAEALAERFSRGYWLADKGFFAMARTADGPAAVMSSNAGQALWSGIVRPDHARRTMESLLAPPMWSGWGIRTLSEESRRYNPVSYHRGTVWPHDNAIIAAGLRRYGFDDAAERVISGILDAATYFPMHRLPELFSGFRRADYGAPVRYPVACHPQAWAAGGVLFMLSTMLGLVPEGFDNRLRVVRPMIPARVDRVALRGLRIGRGQLDLGFLRRADGSVSVETLRNEGNVEVKVE